MAQFKTNDIGCRYTIVNLFYSGIKKEC